MTQWPTKTWMERAPFNSFYYIITKSRTEYFWRPVPKRSSRVFFIHMPIKWLNICKWTETERDREKKKRKNMGRKEEEWRISCIFMLMRFFCIWEHVPDSFILFGIIYWIGYGSGIRFAHRSFSSLRSTNLLLCLVPNLHARVRVFVRLCVCLCLCVVIIIELIACILRTHHVYDSIVYRSLVVGVVGVRTIPL